MRNAHEAQAGVTVSHFLYNLGTAYAVLLTAFALTLAQYAVMHAVDETINAWRARRIGR